MRAPPTHHGRSPSIVCCLPAALFAGLRDGLPGERLHPCASPDQLVRAIASLSPRLVVLDLSAQIFGGIEPWPELLDHLAAVPTVARLSLSAQGARHAAAIAARCASLRLSLDGFDDLSRDVLGALIDRGAATADRVLVDRIATAAPTGVRELVVAAIAAGKRRTSVASFARICGVPPRTLEWRLRNTSLVPTRDLLGRMLSLRAVWHLEDGRPLKAVARSAGFRSESGLSHYVRRHLGVRPSHASRAGLAALLDPAVLFRRAAMAVDR